ncbi:MAG: DNA repair protein RadA [Xanthomonadales bacterium]|nr:DNA repair protein RadA [Xanthomonadales bacterium]
MAPRTTYVCDQCGSVQPKWAGQCPDCQAWNSLTEQLQPALKSRAGGFAGTRSAQVEDLAAVPADRAPRQSSGLAELDRVLGGGIVAGSVVLIGGDPGIGKSTLLLQVLVAQARTAKVLYVSGEESLGQIAARAGRMDADVAGVRCVAETDVDAILATAAQERPQLLVIDSIQTCYTGELTAAPGSVSQVRESAARLTRFAKQQGISVFLIGHVTKEGGIAGPRILEHMVDAVLYFEGDGGGRLRILRGIKNRFGAINEIGVFAMTDRGLREVPNPSALFLSGAETDRPGSAIMVTREGTRPLLVEVQALVDGSPLSNPRRVAVGVEQNRLALLLAVLHRHGGLSMADQDVFVNVVGGIRVNETAADLPTVLAVASSLRDRPLPARTISFGEIGLAGEIRPVSQGEERLKEAAAHGFRQALVPKANGPKKRRFGELEIIPIERLSDALEALSR